MKCTLQLKPASTDGAPCGRVYVAGPVRYAEMPPPQDLAHDIACFWSLHIDPGAGECAHHLLPDLTTDVISIDGGPAFVRGPPTAAQQVLLRPGAMLAGARLRAGAARWLLDCSSVDLLNRVLPLSALIPAQLHGFVPESEQLHAAVARMLRSSMAINLTRPDPTVRSAIEWLAANCRSSVDELSRQVGWSNRKLRRQFVASVGVGPKMVQRIVRVQHALRVVHVREGKIALSQLALECGFADQAHLSREVTCLTDLTPRRVLLLAQTPELAVAPRS